MMRALIDTCVVIDALQGREPFAAEARDIFYAAAGERFEGYITAKSAADIYYIMHRHPHNDTETRAALRKLFALFELLDTAASDCINAAESEILDYEDAVMSETAARSGMGCIVTRNARDYSASRVPIYTPHEFLALLA